MGQAYFELKWTFIKHCIETQVETTNSSTQTIFNLQQHMIRSTHEQYGNNDKLHLYMRRQ